MGLARCHDYSCTTEGVAFTPANGRAARGIVVDLNSQTNMSFTVPAGSTDWVPGAQQNAPASFFAAIKAPDLCNGGLMYNSEGASLGLPSDPMLGWTSTPLVNGGHINWQFHY
jgi:hypothetical protein